jgi:hypothetical protein
MKVLKLFLLAALLAAATLSINSCNKGGKISSIVMTPSDKTSMANGTRQLFTATATFTDGSVFAWSSVMEWSSSVVSVATVTNDIASSKGLVDAISYGTTTITATDTVNNITVSTALTVTDPQSITVTPNNPYMAINTAHQFNATATLLLSDNTTTIAQDITTAPTVSWVSSAIGIANVNNLPGFIGTGVVLATSVTGTTTITATHLISGKTGNTVLTVMSTSLVSPIAITPINPIISLSTTTQQPFTATGTYGDGSTQNLTLTSSVNWSSSNTAVAAINSAGIAAVIAPGTTIITAIDPITNIAGSTTLLVQ